MLRNSATALEVSGTQISQKTFESPQMCWQPFGGMRGGDVVSAL